MSKSVFLKLQRDQHPKNLASTRKIRIDKILRECLEQDERVTHLRRNGSIAGRELVFAEVLSDLEISGDAMRYIDCKGRTAWKATPQLRDYLNDQKLDAEDELEDENT